VRPVQISLKNIYIFSNPLLTAGGDFDIIIERLCETGVYYAVKREIASFSAVTSVEYVR